MEDPQETPFDAEALRECEPPRVEVCLFCLRSDPAADPLLGPVNRSGNSYSTPRMIGLVLSRPDEHCRTRINKGGTGWASAADGLVGETGEQVKRSYPGAPRDHRYT